MIVAKDELVSNLYKLIDETLMGPFLERRTTPMFLMWLTRCFMYAPIVGIIFGWLYGSPFMNCVMEKITILVSPSMVKVSTLMKHILVRSICFVHLAEMMRNRQMKCRDMNFHTFMRHIGC